MSWNYQSHDGCLTTFAINSRRRGLWKNRACGVRTMISITIEHCCRQVATQASQWHFPFQKILAAKPFEWRGLDTCEVLLHTLENTTSHKRRWYDFADYFFHHSGKSYNVSFNFYFWAELHLRVQPLWIRFGSISATPRQQFENSVCLCMLHAEHQANRIASPMVPNERTIHCVGSIIQSECFTVSIGEGRSNWFWSIDRSIDWLFHAFPNSAKYNTPPATWTNGREEPIGG